ncbi:hypothetical protein [Sphingomonas sp.]|uniref:hypothetical protein n=1 Tax=Sphingomonas sp. TaxID=28214 RepID=UPI003B0077CA
MRRIVEDPQFTEQVRQLGGARRIDVALDTIMDGLMRDPEGFARFDSEHFSFRYAKTVLIGKIAALTVVFVLDQDGNVFLKQIEENVPF